MATQIFVLHPKSMHMHIRFLGHIFYLVMGLYTRLYGLDREFLLTTASSAGQTIETTIAGHDGWRFAAGL